MTSPVLLDNVTHADTVVASHFSTELGDNIASTLTFPGEFVRAGRCFPILFRRDDKTNKLHAVILMGLVKNENLFLSEVPPFTHYHGSWLADYVPAMMARGPFAIGLHHQQGENAPMVHIDMSHPKVGHAKGKKLFLSHGGNSEYLNHVSRSLMTIHNGLSEADSLYVMLDNMKLFEPVSIDVELSNGDALKVAGHFTISEERLSQLTAQQLHQLNQSGYLKNVVMAASSLDNVQKLVDLKNARIQAAQP